MQEPDPEILCKLISEHVSDGIVLTGADGRTIWVNPAFTRISGYDLEDMFEKRPGDILQGKGNSPESKQTLANAIATKTTCKLDVVNYSKTGHAYISEINLGPIFDEDGDVTHFVAVQRDVTSERALAQQSLDFKAYQRALDQQAIISMTDARGIMIYVNDKFSAVSGYGPEELIGKTHRIVNSGTHDQAFFRNMWRAIRTGHTWHGDVCNMTKTGEIYWVDTTIVPVHGSGGEIVSYVSIRYEITQRKAVEQKLRRIAETDALTGLATRARFAQDLTKLVADSLIDPEDKGGLVIMFDIDHFKELNDSRGHHFGDLLLEEIAGRLSAFAGPGHVVARLGGDEFAALIPNDVVGDDPADFLASLHRNLCRAVLLSDTIYLPSVSIGVTHYPSDGGTYERLLINADVALYEAKRNGRNQVCFFDRTVRARMEYRNQLKTLLADAIDTDRFEIMLQPFCCIRTGAHRGFEVLMRLTDNGTPVPPEDFVPLAEELGLISQIGRIIMQKALAAHQAMAQLGVAPGKLALNVAAPEFNEDGFVAGVLGLLAEHEISPQDLVIEITETALIGRSTEIVAQALRRLQQTGVLIALDDFGTGFSSLSHLKNFDVDEIKIHKSFVQDLEHDPSDRALVDGVISLARRLGIEVVAEGVETRAQIVLLRDFGCHYLQGFIHSRPLTVEDAVIFLQTPRATSWPKDV